MNIIKQDITALMDFAKHPVSFIQNKENVQSFYAAFRRWMILLLILTGLMALATLVNYDEFLRVNMAQMESMFNNPYVSQNTSPWRNVFLLPMMGFCMVLMTGFGRHLMVMILGEKNTSMARTQSITIYAMLPLVVVLGFGTLIRILWPEMPIPGKPINFSGREVFLSMMMFAAIVFEMVLCIKALRAQYGQQLGRAILTYFSPMILCNITGIGLALVLGLFLMGSSGIAG